MEKKKKIGFTSQGYEPPRAESVAVAQESILCASGTILEGQPENFTEINGVWG